MYQALAEEYNLAFVGAHEYFSKLHEYGKYFITDLKGNMVNHPHGNVDFYWGDFDKVISRAIIATFADL